MEKLNLVFSNVERDYDLASLGLSFDSEPEDILNVADGIVREEIGVNLKDDNDRWIVKIQKIESSRTVYIFPDSPAGK